jgi:hypothetical protein
MDGHPMLHLIGHLSPVVHPKNWDLIRVPVRKVDSTYVVYVAEGYHRIYDTDTLPDKLKTKMAMIRARGNDTALFEPEKRLQKMVVYINYQSDELDEIGWRVSQTYYCLVLDRDTLESLKGENHE